MKAPSVAEAAVRGAGGALTGLANLWRTEPAACTAVVVAGLGVLTEFGLPITETKQAVMVALLTACGGLLVRARVSPVARPTPAPGKPGAGIEPVPVAP